MTHDVTPDLTTGTPGAPAGSPSGPPGPEAEEDALRRPVGWWLRLVDGLVEDAVEDAFRRHGLARRHWQVLNVVLEGAADETAVAEELAPFTDDAATPLADLRERGWVTPAGEPLALTEAGREAQEDLLVDVTAVRERSVEGVPEADLRTTLATLRRMARNLSDAG